MVFKPCGAAEGDPLLCLATGENPCGARRARARPAGRRISAAELRARGVDEAFLAPAQCIDAGLEVPADAGQARKAVAFVSGGAAVVDTGAGEGAKEQMIPHPEVGAASRIKVEPAWSAGEMHAEYGVGYALLVAMGYQGGGRVPLAGVKRQERVALQDDEALALDRSCPVGTKKRQRSRAVLGGGHCSVPKALSTGKGLGENDMARQLEMSWALDPSEDVAAGTCEQLGIDGDSSPESDDFEVAAGATGRLQRAILLELRHGRGRMPLADLVQLPRVQRALSEHPEASNAAQGFLCSFIRSSLPQCSVRQSLAPSLMKLARSCSSLSWDRAARREPVVALRLSGRHGEGRGGGSEALQARDSSSDESSGSSQGCGTGESGSGKAAPQAPAGVRPSGGPPGTGGWHCRGCQRSFASRASLREHAVERLCARTTHDPTDLSAHFDPEHRDRDALLRLAGSPSLADDLQCPGRVAGCPVTWRCPACNSWRGEPGPGFAMLLQHADLCPAGRVAHGRLLSLIAELLLQEPPPETPAQAGPWRPPRLRRLLRALAAPADAADDEYRLLEEEVLGPQEADMFTNL
mmetsp:Transcript_85916/g.256224  ORF Transcript_85916/g.256224 Transcript_85916/m.256224 type:complete len:580 (+) Transcript_85916:89-1828(+)